MKGGTGLFVDNEHLEEHFIDFISNSDITFLGKGTFGIIVRANLRAGFVSNYKNMDYANYNTPVTSIIVKLGVFKYAVNLPQHIKQQLVEESSETEFVKEVNLQTTTFLKTVDYLQPLCPAIIYSKVCNEDDNVLDILYNNFTGNDKSVIQQLQQYASRYSIIGMELFRNSVSINRVSNPKYRNMAIYLIIEFALKTGYSHADFHDGNIMINVNDTTYFKGIRGSPILIDFGLSKQIDVPIMKKIQSLFHDKSIQKRYNKIIKILCNVPRSDGLDVNKYKVYDNICKYNCVDTEIDVLFDAKERAKDDIALAMPTVIPLSNAAKKNMFPGMIEDNTEDIDVIQLDVDATSQNDINDVVKRVIQIFWSVFETGFLRDYLSKNEAAKMCINSCAIAVYLIQQNNTNIKLNTIPIASIYCAGFDEKYVENSNINRIYFYLTKHDDPSSRSGGDIGSLTTAKSLIQNTHIISIGDFMNENDFKTFSNYDESIQTEIMSNLDVYNNPKEYVKQGFVKKKAISSTPKYTFPMKTARSVLGGKGKRCTRKRRYRKNTIKKRTHRTRRR